MLFFVKGKGLVLGIAFFCGFDHEFCWARACDVLFCFGDRLVEDLHRTTDHVPL